ncbi:ankyrin repeat domain-containing protein SOWAHA-like [Glandiceps talaboti]
MPATEEGTVNIIPGLATNHHGNPTQVLAAESRGPHVIKCTRDNLLCEFVTLTALHWAAKHGRKDLIRLLANQPSFNVNVRSGYTPLHIAAMQGQEAIVQSLISDYKADVNIRDYSGKKAKQHLKKNASNYIQRMLQGATKVYTVRRGQRSESMEKKRSSVPFFNKPLKWGSAENVSQSKKDKTPPITPPESPNINRHSSLTAISDKELMPPPKLVPGKRSKRKKKEEARESEIRRAESEPDLTS